MFVFVSHSLLFNFSIQVGRNDCSYNNISTLLLYYSKASKTEALDLCVSEVALFSHEAGRHFILIFGIYCSFQHDEAGIFKCFCFIWKL